MRVNLENLHFKASDGIHEHMKTGGWRSKSFTYREFLIQLVGEEGVGQLSEVQLTQGAHTVDVLDVHVFGQVRDLLRVELVPDGGEPAQRQSWTQRRNFSFKAKLETEKSRIFPHVCVEQQQPQQVKKAEILISCIQEYYYFVTPPPEHIPLLESQKGLRRRPHRSFWMFEAMPERR